MHYIQYVCSIYIIYMLYIYTIYIYIYTIRAGEAYGIVRKTGVNTEIGGSQVDILKDKTIIKTSVFEERILLAVKVIILIALIDVIIIFFFQGFAGQQFYTHNYDLDLLTCLSIIIASIPIALPLVLQVIYTYIICNIMYYSSMYDMCYSIMYITV